MVGKIAKCYGTSSSLFSYQKMATLHTAKSGSKNGHFIKPECKSRAQIMGPKVVQKVVRKMVQQVVQKMAIFCNYAKTTTEVFGNYAHLKIRI